jgi:hypothetical protein
MSASDRFVDNVRLINDVLRDSPLAGRYGVWGGLLLGIIRNGRPLERDLDADFYFQDVDEERFLTAVPALLKAGFQRLYKFVANDGTPWEYTLTKDDGRFDFFRFTRIGSGRVGYFDFVPGTNPVQQWKAYVDAPLVPMDFLERVWLVADDTDAALTSLYGNWRVEDRNWNYAQDPFTLRREPWLNAERAHWT